MMGSPNDDLEARARRRFGLPPNPSASAAKDRDDHDDHYTQIRRGQLELGYRPPPESPAMQQVFDQLKQQPQPSSSVDVTHLLEPPDPNPEAEAIRKGRLRLLPPTTPHHLSQVEHVQDDAGNLIALPSPLPRKLKEELPHRYEAGRSHPASPWLVTRGGGGNLMVEDRHISTHFVPVDFSGARFEYDGRRVTVWMEGRLVDSFEASPQAVAWAVRAYVSRRTVGMHQWGP